MRRVVEVLFINHLIQDLFAFIPYIGDVVYDLGSSEGPILQVIRKPLPFRREECIYKIVDFGRAPGSIALAFFDKKKTLFVALA